jgi:Tfp pilus assembly protein PilX
MVFNNKKGFIMVLTMVVLVVLTVMGIGGLMLSGFQQDIAGRLRCRMKSLQCAETGKAMMFSRFNARVETIASFPFPAQINTTIPGVCQLIISGHLPDTRTDTVSLSLTGSATMHACTNNVGCQEALGGGGKNYISTIVGQAENCEPVEIEVGVNSVY